MATQLKQRVSAPVLAEAPTASVVSGETAPAALLSVATRPPVVLTKRERRVKDVLLKELARMNTSEIGASGLTYSQRQHLEKNLSVAYLDKEIGGLRKKLALLSKSIGPVALVTLIMIAVVAWSAWGGVSWTPLIQALGPIALLVIIPVQQRALRRKLFIYEALRELTDADEADVLLDAATRNADALIQRIVEREIEADAQYAIPLTKARN